MKKILIVIGGFVAAGLIVSFAPALNSAAEAASTNSTITGTIGSSITVVSSGNVAIAVIPTASAATSSSSHTVTVSTNNATGYNLTLASSTASTPLTNGANTIPASAATPAAPATLTGNSWGFRVVGAGGFGATATTAETNVASSAFTWAGVPAAASPYTIDSPSTPQASKVTTVWYAVSANSTLQSGAYTNTVTYTATTK